MSECYYSCLLFLLIICVNFSNAKQEINLKNYVDKKHCVASVNVKSCVKDEQ